MFASARRASRGCQRVSWKSSEAAAAVQGSASPGHDASPARVEGGLGRPLAPALRSLLLALACAALVRAVPVGSAAAAEERTRPNVILFLTDDQGFGDLGCHGNPHLKTPNLDAFAAEALELTQFHVSPVCSPTRASLMTGRYNFRTGVCDVFGKACAMDPEEVTIAEALRAAGYATGMFGKWHLGDDPRKSPNAQGFDEALTFPGAAMRRGQYFNPELLHNGRKERFQGYCMDIYTDAAIAFMKRNRERPFFLYLPTNLVHVPLEVADELAAPYGAAGLSSSTAKVYGMLGNIDQNFGRLRAALRELGLEENTLLIFTSDNGPCSSSLPLDRFMAGLHGLKGTVYENGIRVPCFVRWPARLKSPGKIDRLAAHIDLMPTILEACGAPVPAGVKLDGQSLLPLLRDPAAAWPDRTLFFQWDSGQTPRRGHAFAVRGEHWKLVQPAGMDSANQKHIRDRYAELCALQGRGQRSIEGPPRYELYQIDQDPGETRDVAAEHPELVEKMTRQYEAWFDDVAARWRAEPAAAQRQQAERPSIVVLLTDDQRWDTLGCAGNRIVKTPEMDRLAAEGTFFANAFVTSSICAASRASIFTGMYERRHGCNFNTGCLKRSFLQKSYPVLLRQAGYYTGFIGKYGVGDGKREVEGAELFDRWFGFYGQGAYFPKDHPGKHLNEVMVEQTRQFLDGAPADRPFCLSVSFKAPHSGRGYLGYEPEPSLRNLYAELTIPYPPTARQEYFDALPEFLRRCNARTNYWQQRYGTPEQYQAVMKDYYRLITGVDQAIGRIRAELRRRGLEGRTVILLLSDNGDMTGDYMLGGKELLYDASLRVPLLVYDPRVEKAARGQRRTELVLNIDIAPTVLDLAGLSPPPAMQGRSLVPLVRGQTPAWRDAFFCENNFRQPNQDYPLIEGLRTARWKYVRYPETTPLHEQLFDLTRDPLETKNLARAAEGGEILSQLRQRCDVLCAAAR